MKASKTLIFNALNALVATTASLTPDMLPFVVDERFWKWIFLINLVGTTILRAFTNEPLFKKGDKNAEFGPDSGD